MNSKRNKSFLCILFVFLFAVSALFSGCSGKETSDVMSETAIDTEYQVLDTSPSTSDISNDNTPHEKNNYDGASFVVVCASGNENSDMFYDADMPSEFSKQIKIRNEAVENAIGIKIKEQSEQDVAEYVRKLSKTEQSPDLVYASGNGGMSELMLYGCLASLSDYREHNTTAAGISVSVVQQLSVYEQLYMLTGAPIRSSLESASVVAYDSAALQSIGYEDEYLCELVLEGDWTLDKMTLLSKQARAINESDDTYRPVSGSQSSLYSLWKGLGARTVEKANGDVPTIAVYSPKNVFLFEQVNSFSDGVEGIPDTNKALFYIGTVSEAREAYGEDYGVLPTPAYNEDGEYTCLLDFGSTFFTSMPIYAANREMTLDFLREFYALSVDSIYPIITSDSCYKDSRVLDIILKARYFDFLDMYGIGHIVSTAFYSHTDRDDFDALLKSRSEFACDALEIALGQTVGENTNKN